MTTEELLEIEEIKRLKYRYVRALDLKLWDDFADCLVDDCRWSSSGATIRHEGREPIVKWVTEAVGAESRLTSHTVGQPEINLTGRLTATGTWKLESLVTLIDQDLTIRGAGFYYDEYTKKTGQWRKQATGHELIFEETYPRASLGTRLTASRWATGGVQELSSASAGLPPVVDRRE